MKQRHVTHRLSGQPASDGAGVKLQRIIGQPALPRLDPFLLLDHFSSDQPDDYIAGFPAHPHRGFQTVTYMLAGKMRHRDSKANEGTISAGGIQWMNAGRGLIHEEIPQQTAGLLSGFQLWVNLPAEQKMSDPGYQDIPPEAVPRIQHNSATIDILAGSVEGVTGPVKHVPVDPLFVHISTDHATQVSVAITESHTAFCYCYQGGLIIAGSNDEDNQHVNTVQNNATTSAGTQINEGELAVLSEGASVTLQMAANSGCIVIAGAPLNESVVQYGPFVMNTQQQIDQALKDYQAGNFG